MYPDGTMIGANGLLVFVGLALIVIGRIANEKPRGGGSSVLTSIGLVCVVIACVMIVANEFSERYFEGYTGG